MCSSTSRAVAVLFESGRDVLTWAPDKRKRPVPFVGQHPHKGSGEAPLGKFRPAEINALAPLFKFNSAD